MKRTIIALVGLWVGTLGQAVGQTNSWLGGDGSWQTQSQWSLNQLPASSQDIVLTNLGAFTVIIDDQTTSNFPATMTVSSLSVSNFPGTTTLLLTNPPISMTPIALIVSNTTVISSGAVLNEVDDSGLGSGVLLQSLGLVVDGTVFLHDNTTLSVGGSAFTYGLHVGSSINTTGTIELLGGLLLMNSSIALGDRGSGYMVTSNGVLQAGEVDLGAKTGGFGSWRIDGGSNTVNNDVAIGYAKGATGEVVMTGGRFTTAGNLEVGGDDNNAVGGVGRLVVSNGVINAANLLLAGSPVGMGTVTVAGGILNVSGHLYVGNFGSTGTVWLIGGEIDVTNNSGLLEVGDYFPRGLYHNQLISSGGVLRATEVDAGRSYYPTSSVPSPWVIVGGTSIVSRVFLLGAGEQVDSLTVSGGRLQALT